MANRAFVVDPVRSLVSAFRYLVSRPIYSSYVIWRPPIPLNSGVSNWQSMKRPPSLTIVLAR